jgi:hypothetical protein
VEAVAARKRAAKAEKAARVEAARVAQEEELAARAAARAEQDAIFAENSKPKQGQKVDRRPRIIYVDGPPPEEKKAGKKRGKGKGKSPRRPPPSSDIMAGHRVRVSGLTSEAGEELNGQTGQVSEGPNVNGRFTVRVSPLRAGVALKRANFDPLPASSRPPLRAPPGKVDQPGHWLWQSARDGSIMCAPHGAAVCGTCCADHALYNVINSFCFTQTRVDLADEQTIGAAMATYFASPQPEEHATGETISHILVDQENRLREEIATADAELVVANAAQKKNNDVGVFKESEEKAVKKWTRRLEKATAELKEEEDGLAAGPGSSGATLDDLLSQAGFRIFAARTRPDLRGTLAGPA